MAPFLIRRLCASLTETAMDLAVVQIRRPGTGITGLSGTQARHGHSHVIKTATWPRKFKMSGKLLPMKRARLEELESCSTGLSRQPETTMAYTKPYPHRQDAESFDARLIMANPYHRARQYEHQRKAFGLPCAPDENGVEADSFGRDQMPTPQAHQVRYQSCFDGAAGYSHAEADGAAVCKTAPYRRGIREVPVQALTDDVLPPAYSESTASHESLYAFPHPSNAPRPSPSLPGVASPSPSSPPRLSKLIAIPATDATPG